ncbi:hypothetical protein HPP92_010779 [Vanilla planifolia]|uniref:Deoxyhypusine synthase n=1 Tax=Vanilla planifolia TaxID=51239 RepID=A0A835V3U0_VANPL|nr:hypothetical protein HPP92_011031 [Vanilla planifolia]KAG0482695.1 hypothetical protein HPP92_010779 [Vanilla planifolia]
MGGASAEGRRESLDAIRSVVFKESEILDESRFRRISGYDFNQGVNFMSLLDSMVSTGFQASNLGDAIAVVNDMLDWRLSHEKPAEDCREEELDLAFRESVRCKIFLGFTSNLVSSGIRDIIRFLVEHKMVDVVVTTAGGIEEDLIKCLAPTYRGDFSLPGAYLRSKGLNRIGNLLVPNDNYCKFENWINPILDQMLKEQSEKHMEWTPSKVISRLGKEINDESSYLYWAYKNGIPVFCPGLTDGSLGDMLYCHAIRSSGLKIDIVQDIRAMNGEAVHVGLRKTGMIILGGGLPKHHICNANMMRNGSDYAIFINTAQEFDGSDSGAQPDEAVSWGKIRGSAKTIKVHCDATIAFPLLVAATFARRLQDSALNNRL